MRRLGLVLCILAALAALAACGDGPGAQGADDDTAGMGVPQQRGSEQYPGDRQALALRVHVSANGCFLGSLEGLEGARRYLVVWPAGTEQGASGEVLRLPDGTAVQERAVLTGQGLLMPTRRLEGFGAEGYWDFAVGFCTPGARDVLVLDDAARR